MKFITYFYNIKYDVHYDPTKFELKTQYVWREKRQIFLWIRWDQLKNSREN